MFKRFQHKTPNRLKYCIASELSKLVSVLRKRIHNVFKLCTVVTEMPSSLFYTEKKLSTIEVVVSACNILSIKTFTAV